jgi:hypothetical protein
LRARLLPTHDPTGEKRAEELRTSSLDLSHRSSSTCDVVAQFFSACSREAKMMPGNIPRLLCADRPRRGSLWRVRALRWYPPHVTTKRLIDEGLIGEPIEVHFYDGNRGPLYHRADKVVVSDEEVAREKPGSWWYKKASGGGSLFDYLGYGATLGARSRDSGETGFAGNPIGRFSTRFRALSL